MARTYLFLVHGVGKHPADTWADSWKQVLIEKLKRFPPYSGMTNAHIEKEVLCFVPISYDSIFEGYRERWGTLAGALTATEFVSNPAALTALQWVADQGSDDVIQKVFWEKVLDVILWATNPQARAAVIAHVNKQLVDGLVQMNQEAKDRQEAPENRAHIVAHSLGTSVISDALIALNGAQSVHEGALDTSVFQWRSLFMVANTSRFLEPRFDVSDELDPADFKVHSSKLKPGSTDSIVLSYRNVHHKIDPITFPRPFGPPDWPPKVYRDIKLKRFKDPKKVHDFETYVSDFHFHRPLFQKIFGNNRIGNGMKDNLKAGLNAELPMIADVEFPDLRELAKGDSGAIDDLRVLVQYLTDAFKELS
jgi:hypothetical protein